MSIAFTELPVTSQPVAAINAPKTTSWCGRLCSCVKRSDKNDGGLVCLAVLFTTATAIGITIATLNPEIGPRVICSGFSAIAGSITIGITRHLFKKHWVAQPLLPT